MTANQRSATQIFRQAQQGQLLEHVALIQELEGKVASLEADLARVRRGGGTRELQRLPGEAMEVLVRVFDAVPIPDLSAWERRQSLARLTSVLSPLEASGKLPPGTWDPEGPSLTVAEGDGSAVALATGEVVKVLGEAAGKYLAQMVEFQGTTPDVVSRARAASLMDVSSLVDAKAQFGVLPSEGQRELFEDNVDELIKAKDQLATIASWLNQGRDLTQRLLERRGLSAARGASLLGLLQTLDASDAGQQVPNTAAVHDLLLRYGGLLPGKDVLERIGLGDTEYQRACAASVSPESPLAFQARALQELLNDHERVVAALGDTALAAREKKALGLLNKSKAGSAAKARKELLSVVARLSAVEEAQAVLEETQKAVVKRFSTVLERRARQVFAEGERPEAQAAAFERLDKSGKNAFLAGQWLDLVDRLRALLEPQGEGSVASLRAVASAATLAVLGDDDRAALESRRRSLDVLLETLRHPSEDEDAHDLTVTSPIDVEQGLLDRQREAFALRRDEFLSKFSQAKSAGMQTLASAASRLGEVEALKREKKATLDKLLKGSRKGKHSPKKELGLAVGLLAEERGIDEALAALEARRAAALAQVADELTSLGLSPSLGHARVLAAATAQRAQVAAAAEAIAEADRAASQAGELALTLGAGQATVPAATALLTTVAADAAELGRLAQQVARAQAETLETANRLFRKKAPDFGAARLTLAEATSGLDEADALRAAAATYVGGFSVFDKGLSSLTSIRAWVKREGKKAAALTALAEDAVTRLEKAISKLAQGSPRER